MSGRARRVKGEDAVIVFKLNSLTATLAQSSCHACGRDNQGLTFSSRRKGCAGAAITICSPCMTDILAYHRDYLASHARQL